MAEDFGDDFDLDTTIGSRIAGDPEPNENAHLQALAVLIDADLTDAERADAFASVMNTMLSRLSTGDRERFCQIADVQGEVAAMSYLSTITRPVNQVDRR